MPAKQELSWIKLFAEASAIVLSILLAFSIDAWWNLRQERANEGVMLAALARELAAIEQEMFNNTIQAEVMISSARSLLQHGRNPALQVSDNQIDRWLCDTTWNFSGLESAVTDSLVKGGRLNLLSSTELQVMLVKWPAHIDYLSNNNLRNQDFLDQQYSPFVRANGSIAQIYAADAGQPGHRDNAYPYGTEIEGFTPIPHRKLIEMPEFQNLLVDRIILLNEIVGYGAEVEVAKELTEIRLMLERG